MKRNIKFYILLFILLCLSCFMFYVITYAEDSELVVDVLADYPDLPTTYTFDDGVTRALNNYILTSGDNGSFLFCYVDVGAYTYYVSNGDINTVCGSLGEYIVRFKLSNNSWGSAYDYSRSSVSSASTSPDNLVYSSVNIYSNSTASDLVFQGAPLLSVVGLTQNQIASLTMKEILGLAPLVIGSAICWMGLRKALRMLWTRLRQA